MKYFVVGVDYPGWKSPEPGDDKALHSLTWAVSDFYQTLEPELDWIQTAYLWAGGRLFFYIRYKNENLKELRSMLSAKLETCGLTVHTLFKCQKPSRDQIEKRNQQHFTHATPGRKLTWDQVCQIRSLYVPGKQCIYKTLITQFGVSERTINDIVRMRTWRERRIGDNEPVRKSNEYQY
jgi:hypothetical protein